MRELEAASYSVRWASDGPTDAAAHVRRGRSIAWPYLGVRGWVGVRLDVPGVDRARVADLVADAYGQVAPKWLVAQLEAAAAAATEPRILRM